MKPFTHKTVIGTFFDVLAAQPAGLSREVTVSQGATTRQDAVLCVLSGDLTLERLPAFAAALRKLLTSTVHVIALDLSRIHIFCPNAVSVLVNFVSFVEGGGKRLILFRPSTRVRETLDSLNIAHLFEILHTEDDLLLVIPD